MDLMDPRYDPNKFMDWVRRVMHARNDRHLARLLRTSPALLSRIRSCQAPVSVRMLIGIHEHTGLRTKEIKEHMFFKQE